MRNISAWAIRHPVTPIVLFVLLFFAGLISFARLPVNLQPDIAVSAVASDPLGRACKRYAHFGRYVRDRPSLTSFDQASTSFQTLVVHCGAWVSLSIASEILSEPMVCIRFVIEGIDLDETGCLVEMPCFSERAVCFQLKDNHST